MRLTLMALGLIGVAALVSACSNGDSNPDPNTSDVSAEFEAAAQTTAVGSLLTLADFPEGWTRTPSDPNEPDLGLAGDCAVLEADGLPGDVAHAESDDFTGPDDQQVTTGTSIFADATGGEQAFDAYASTFSACADELTAKFEQALRDEFAVQGIAPELISDLTVSVNPMNVPVGADDSMAYRLLASVTVQGQPMQFAYDVSVVRQGKVLGYLSYYTQGEPSAAEETSLAQALATKLRGGNAQLS